MASNREADRGVGYPRLTADQIALIVDQLLFVLRQRDLGPDLDEAEAVFAYLTSFYTKRWGLPPVLSRGDQSMST